VQDTDLIRRLRRGNLDHHLCLEKIRIGSNAASSSRAGAGFIGSVLVWELNRRVAPYIVVVDVPGRSELRGNLGGLRYFRIPRRRRIAHASRIGFRSEESILFSPGRVFLRRRKTNEAYLRENN